MSDADTRALGRAALILLVASVVRVAWRPDTGAVAADGEPVLPGLLEETRRRTAEEERRGLPLGDGERLDPNVVSAVELDRLPGVGPATARAIVENREDVGMFARVDDLLRVRGVGPVLLEKLRPHLDVAAVSGSTTGRPGPSAGSVSRGGAGGRGGGGSARRPVDVNRADTVALQELPGVGPALARRIAEARADAPFRSVDDLLRVRGIGPATLERLRPLVRVGR